MDPSYEYVKKKRFDYTLARCKTDIQDEEVKSPEDVAEATAPSQFFEEASRDADHHLAKARASEGRNLPGGHETVMHV